MIRGLVSIGTNSTRALVARFGASVPEVLVHRSIGTRIGEGLRERGHLEEAAMRRTLDAIAQHAAAIREHTPSFRVIATSALRRADNRSEFDERVHALTDEHIAIVSGEEEAACSFTGALSGIEAPAHARFGVLDVGGGSSEYAVGTKAQLDRVVSCEIGAVRLTEAFPALAGTSGRVSSDVRAAAAERAQEALEPAAALGKSGRLVLVGGSATSTVALVRGDRTLFRYADLSAADLDEWIARLAGAGLEERKAFAGMNPQRADILLGGQIIVREFMRASGHPVALASTNDVLLGYLLRNANG